ncbi:ABC transporter permease [Patescibacteria group bacterium]|nr:ABC transporter permease [Patescibacteria group bacterium]
MNYWLTIKLAVTGLLANKMRAFLTVLGTIIGVSSIIMIIAIGNGAESMIINQIESVGSNLVGILPGGSEEGEAPAAMMGIVVTTLKYDDIKALEDIPHVVAAAGYNESIKQVVYGNTKTETSVIGTMASYTLVEDALVAKGRFFNEIEERSTAKVAVIGDKIREDLFGDSNPIGQTVKIEGTALKVIGYMDARGSSGFSNKDTQIYIPIQTMQKLILGINHVAMARVKIDDAQYTDQTMDAMENLIRSRHGIDIATDDDFTIASQTQQLETVSSVTGAIKIMLTFIAFIALIVGGIGIMNVMYIAVTERTREIGLRKAIGAKPADIMRQFLVEAVAITGIGGIVGIIIGVFLSAMVAIGVQTLGYTWSFIIDIDSLIVASLTIVGIGIVFGYAPAKKASQLNAIDALRYE